MMTTCIVPGENHSTDTVTVWHGQSTPALACGYHAYYWPELVAREARVESSNRATEGQTAPSSDLPPHRQEEK